MGPKWSGDRRSKLFGVVSLGFAALISVSFIPTPRAQTPGPCRPQGAVSVTYHTFTNAKGQYRVFAKIAAPFRIQVGAVNKEVSQLPVTRRIDFVLSR